MCWPPIPGKIYVERLVPQISQSINGGAALSNPYVVIKTYRNKRTENAIKGVFAKGFPSDVVKRAKMRLERIHAAVNLGDLRIPSSHCLERLKGDRKGQYSIRINQQWRICFRWKNGRTYEVEITDCH
jgi:proteic killer suppression protein